MSDLIGISVCSERNLIPHSFYAGTMPMDRLRALYFPEHSQRSFGAYPLLNDSGFAGNQPVIDASVQQARKKYFYCFLKHRLKVFQYSVGANAGEVFYLTDPGVFPGVADTEVTPTGLTTSVTGYIQKTAAAPTARAIVFMVLAALLWFWAYFGRQHQMATRCSLPLVGGFSYLAASFFILPAADARYNFMVNVVAMLCLCALWPKRPKPLPASLQD